MGKCHIGTFSVFHYETENYKLNYYTDLKHARHKALQ